MTEDEMLEVLRENKERIKNAALAAVIAKVEEDLKWHMPQSVSKAISKFMEVEVAPEVAKVLQSQRGAILAAVDSAGAEIGAALHKQLVENASKQLTGYRGGEILKKLVDD